MPGPTPTDPDCTPAILFDFDGTLVDTLPGLTVATNALRARRGLAAQSADVVRGWIGGGLEVLLDGAIGESGPEVHAEFLEVYGGAPLLDSLPFAGIEAMLDRLSGWPLAIVTNKAKASLDRLVDHLGWRGRFRAILSPEDVGARKPEPAFLRAARAAVGAGRPAVLIGDSEFDLRAARAGGAVAAAVTWGLRTRAELVGESPDLWFAHPGEITAGVLLGAVAAAPT